MISLPVKKLGKVDLLLAATTDAQSLSISLKRSDVKPKEVYDIFKFYLLI